MTAVKLLIPVLAATLLASVTACGTSSVPDVPAGASTGSGPAETGRSSGASTGSASAETGGRTVTPVTATMPDVIGGNAGRADEQMGSEIEMVFKDASGQNRPVDDPAEWKICNSRPGPNQQITHYPVVFGVMRDSENCEDAITVPE